MPWVGGFQSFNTARRSIQGFEAMLWLRKGFGFAGACSPDPGSASVYRLVVDEDDLGFTVTKKKAFTEAARAAALAKRREIASLGKPLDAQVFVVRRSAPSLLYGWEIRRFGSIVLSQGETGYQTLAEAREAGDKELAAIRGA